MSAFQAIQERGMVPASHQGSCAENPRAEKVLALAFDARDPVQSWPSVQPVVFEVRRPKPAWLLASSNRPTSPTDRRTHMRVTRIRARRVGRANSALANIKNRLDRLGGWTNPVFMRISTSNLFD